MKNVIKIILFALTALLLFASMFQKTTHLWDFKKLNGVEIPAPMPNMTFHSISDGSFQDGTEAYLKQNFGFRQPLIRFYNQYLWDFYKTSNGNKGILTLGKDGWLYEPWSVEDYYQIYYHQHFSDVDQLTEQLAEEAKRVYQLQHILEPYGTHLFVCLVPSKDLLYPEHLPENQDTRYDDEPKMSARYFLKDEYTRLGVNVLDLGDYFQHMKDTADFTIFPKTGTHWSKYSSLFAADTMIRYMEHLDSINMRNLVIGPRALQDAQEADTDLENLLNLIRPLPRPQYYYATATSDKDTTAVMPKMIVIGDSFWWNIIYQVPVQEIFSEFPYWYYNSSVYYDPTYQSVNEVNLANELLSSDFIILFYSSTQLYKLNNGFTKKALLALCYDPEEIEAAYAKLEQNIRSDSAWIGSLEKASEAQGKPLDELVHNEAQWIIDTHLDYSFPALKDSIPTKRSKWVESYLASDSLAFIEQEVKKNIRIIKGNETQMEAIREKAKQQGKTLEQAIRDDAHWIVNYQIQQGTLNRTEATKESNTETENHGIQ
jgi:hypothetical protein